MPGHYITTRSSTLAKSSTEHPSDGIGNKGPKNDRTPSPLPSLNKAALPGYSSAKRKRDLQLCSGDASVAREHHHDPLKWATLPSPRKSKSKKRMEDDSGTVAEDSGSPPKKRKKPQSPVKSKDEEKRLRVFRKKAPQSYLEKLSRATSQRHVVWTFSWHRRHANKVMAECLSLTGLVAALKTSQKRPLMLVQAGSCISCSSIAV